jgi:hypothetical protein
MKAMSDLVERPRDSNADAWHLFLSKYLDARANFPYGMAFMAVQIAEAIDDAVREQCEAKDAELREIGAILGTQFMDPPDGGDVPIHERVRRAKAEIERLNKLLYGVKGPVSTRGAIEEAAVFQRDLARASAENERLRKALEDAQRAAQLAKRREDTARKFWIRDAKEALAGKPLALRNRVELCESPENEMRVVLSDETLAAHVVKGEKDGE